MRRFIAFVGSSFSQILQLKNPQNEVHSKSGVLLMSIEDFRIKTPLHTGTGKNIVNKIIS